MSAVVEEYLHGSGEAMAAPAVAEERRRLSDLVHGSSLQPHFQPIVDVAGARIDGHEALIRTPAGCPWPDPESLFRAAARHDLTVALEVRCVRLALSAWAQGPRRGRLFLNLSARTLMLSLVQRDLDSIMALARSAGVAPEGLVLELTEHEQVRDVGALQDALAGLRRHKVSLALDDFGDGRSSLRLWSELKPEIVKIDKYFCHELARRPEKLQTLRALQQLSGVLGARLVAEGVETAEDLHLVRDLGIPFAQGWLLGRPAAAPRGALPAEAQAVLHSADLAVFPERRRAASQRATPRTLLREVPPVARSCTNEQLFQRFADDETLRALAIVDDDGRPLGLVGRQRFVDQYAKPFFRELNGRRPCLELSNRSPKLLDLRADIDALAAVLTSDDQRYLSDGVIVVENGRYLGLGSGEDLVRIVTESRIEAARHANPLTLLPGNIPITQHVQRLLDAGREFVACYADLNQFKPFNDLYGYWRGDEMILRVARCIAQHADARRDFVGHVGGDDFIVLFQSEDWSQRCEAIVADFNRQAAELYDESARAAGGVVAEDRHGVQRFHPLCTLSIGAVQVRPGGNWRAEDVASAAARAKHQAKQSGRGVLLIDGEAATAAPTR
jgi:diguanylate cyclase (GGDEF)-like protein